MTWYYVPYTSAPATAASSLPCEAAPEPWLTLSGTPTQRPLSWRGWKERSWIRLLSGLTCAPSTLARGVAVWISSLPVFPASPSAPPASVPGLTMTVGSGQTSAGSSVTFDPVTLFLENVPGVVRHGLPHVLADLAGLGFDAEWGLLSAASVGAPHKRERFWLVAHAARPGRNERGDGAQPRGLPADAQAERGDVGRSGGAGRSEITRGTHGDEGPHGPQHAHQPHRAGEDVAHATGNGGPAVLGAGDGWTDAHRSGHRTRPLSAVGHRFPPRPADTAGWAEWIANGGPQPSIRRGVDGATAWLADALHLGGNGLVPQCARVAWDQLTARLEH